MHSKRFARPKLFEPFEPFERFELFELFELFERFERFINLFISNSSAVTRRIPFLSYPDRRVCIYALFVILLVPYT